MINQIDRPWWFALNGALRFAIVRYASGRIGYFPLINEYPKSGGSWFAQMVAHITGLPFPRNRLPVMCESVMHGHYLKPEGMRNVSIVWRDGRDILVSLYFHKVVGNKLVSQAAVEECRTDLNFSDIYDVKNNLPKFIDYVFSGSLKQPRYTWLDFYRSWSGQDVFHTKYEDLLIAPKEELLKFVDYFGLDLGSEKSRLVEEAVAAYSFQALSGRSQGQENRDSYLRKGTAGDWKEKFNSESRAIFNHYAGDALIQLGYEVDDSWVMGAE